MKPAAAGIAPALALCLLAAAAAAEEPAAPAPWFHDLAGEAGLKGVPAKDVVLADLDGDGYLDLCLDRERFWHSEGGKGFREWPEAALPFPEVRVVPMTKDGKPDEAKAKTQRHVPAYLYFGDVDNDGDMDAVAGVHSNWEFFDGGAWKTVPGCDPGVRSSVWLNDGRGRFARGPDSGYTAEDAWGPAGSMAFVDADDDGRLDFYEGREYRQYGVLYGCGVDRLWKGDGKGRFADVTRAAGMWLEAEPGGPRSARPTYGVTHADVDGDGRQDLLELAYGRQWNLLWRNKGDGTFEEIGRATNFAGDGITHGKYPPGVGRPAEAPFRSNGNTFDCAVGDFDNDGDLDLFLGEIAHAWAGESSDPPSLLVNESRSKPWSFRRLPVAVFLPAREFRDPANFQYADLHVSWLDADLDGRLDLLVGSGDYPDGQFLRLYRQCEDRSFEDVTEQAGFRWEGCGGLSVGDFDRDGDPDVLAGRSFFRLSQEHRDRFMDGILVNAPGVFRNDVGNRSGNHWLVVRLEGKGAGHANRSGIGARITVTAGGVTRIREIRGGAGVGNHQDPPEACFGLG
ncbi:MAG: VCBS repeat-containing protein, partial [Planctomycetes bacterium]|nr:VCBS repeat-containing protein [Planctomycetota bacterium]